jgi:hypothetical protein
MNSEKKEKNNDPQMGNVCRGSATVLEKNDLRGNLMRQRKTGTDIGTHSREIPFLC